jgi:hypothetical protein
MTNIPLQIANFFTAMQAGRAGAARMETSFASDAVYVEPFSGQPQRHVGRQAIMAAMSRGWDQPLPHMQIVIDRADTSGNKIVIRWTCYSPALPGGKGCGTNRYVMNEEGFIQELETSLEVE